jgi:dTDP-4-amino-4,6-dideoxygalactose transaminase
LKLDKINATRREVFDALAAENVQCNVHYIPVYYFPHYKRLGYEKGLCPHAEAAYEGFISIPLYPAMTDQDVEDVIVAIKKVLDYYKK